MKILISTLNQFIKGLDRNASEINIYYELAPTGLVHLGILRTMLRMNEIRHLLIQEGLNPKTILRINDRYVFHQNLNLQDANSFEGVKLGHIHSPSSKYENFLEWSVDDIKKVIDIFDIKIDRLFYIDDLYKSPKFQELIWSSFDQRNFIEKIIRMSAKKPKDFFHPACDGCGRMYFTSLNIVKNICKYSCSFCGYNGNISPDINGGLVTFKWETALTWKYCNIHVDIHGANHQRAAITSLRIFTELFNSHPPSFYELNLTLGNDGKAMSKSKANFIPVSKLAKMYGVKKVKDFLKGADDKILLKESKLLMSK